MKKLINWVKKASRTNRIFRTFIQGLAGYMSVNIMTLWESGADFKMALEALLVGAIAAGISAIWKTAAAELEDLEESETSMIEQGL